MTQDRAKRKLSAILSADVKGYSRLMGDDELATVRTIEEHRTVMCGDYSKVSWSGCGLSRGQCSCRICQRRGCG